MARIVGVDLGTTHSSISIWDERTKAPVIIPNLRGTATTPSVVGLSETGGVIVGEDARQRRVVSRENTVSEIKREMGTDFRAMMGGKEYSPQTISAFILHYLKLSAERYLGEPVHDAVISVPACFTQPQRIATRDAGVIAGFNVHRLINEPTAAAVAYAVAARQAEGARKTCAVYDLGGGTFDVSIIEIHADDITVVGTGGDSRLGGLDMDEEVMKWALRQINARYHVDLSADDAVRRRLKVEAEDVKKTLVVGETATLNLPYLTVVDGKPLSPSLQITRGQFEMLIQKLVERSMEGFEAAVASAQEHSAIGWDDIDGVILVGGPTRLRNIHDRLRAKLKEHCPDKEPDVRCDLNPDELVALGAAIVAAQPVIRDTVVPAVFDVAGHSLGIAVGGARFVPIIEKESVLPVEGTFGPLANAADDTGELRVEVYQGENECVAANTRIGEVVIAPLEPSPKGHHQIEVTFHLDLSGTLSITSRDVRTGRVFSGGFEGTPTRAVRRHRPEVPGGRVDRVHFSVSGPPSVGPGAAFIVNVWAHLEAQRDAVAARARQAHGSGRPFVQTKGPTLVAQGVVMRINLELEDFVVDQPDDTVLWDGEIGNATFAVRVPERARIGPRHGTATVYADGLQIARVDFTVDVARAETAASLTPASETRHRTAFASYSSDDVEQVAARIQGMLKALPDIDVFWDRHSLRSGQRFEEAILHEIEVRDVFYLFWSPAASRSTWVDKEWRWALHCRGIDYIDPVPLVSPAVAPPPPELGGTLHFNDWVLAYARQPFEAS